MFLLLFSAVFIYNVQFSSTYVISLFGDVYKDTHFFTETLPWIIDNIGGDISVDFYMQGSGRYTVPQMCVLKELSHNTFLQAQYLKCEALGGPSEVCLCESGIDPENFRNCVRHGGNRAAESAALFHQVGIDVTPLIELGPRSTVFGVEDSWYLKKICTIFGDHMPRGCLKPFSCNGTEALHTKNAIAQFHKCCSNMACENTEISTSTTPFSTEKII